MPKLPVVIGVLEYGEVRLFDSMDQVMREWAPYPPTWPPKSSFSTIPTAFGWSQSSRAVAALDFAKISRRLHCVVTRLLTRPWIDRPCPFRSNEPGA